jgi:hypothetical protein
LYLVMLLEILGISFFGLGFLGEILVEMQNRMDFMAKEVGELKSARPPVVVQRPPALQPHQKPPGRPHHQPPGDQRQRPSRPSAEREETTPLSEDLSPATEPEPKFPFEN